MNHANLPDFTSARVLVVGDLMLDRYWYGATSRISPEAPVPVVRVSGEEERPGGAANVALNIVELGGQVILLGVTGADSAADTLQHLLEQRGVDCQFMRLDTVPTITKLRILSRHQQLIRLDFEDTLHFAPDLLNDSFKVVLDDVHVVVLSDYAKGTLKDAQSLIQHARARGIPVLVDPKDADFAKYRGATLITPNCSEFEAVSGTCQTHESLEKSGEKLRHAFNLEALLVTRSEKGMSLLREDHPPLHLPAHAREVFDVTGAGDTVIGVMAAEIAAGLVVAKLGAATVTPAELNYALHTQDSGGAVSEDALLVAVANARANGESIVMTNGCFDIIHAGHVQYLTQARKLGDRLIVAVNDDDSVRRLKGDTRPINPLEQRMTVLSGLAAVDWVVPFGEDTPQRLICRVLPDILVKGGDYTIEDIAGHRCVLDNGGEVTVLAFLDNCSTSNIVRAIQKTMR